MVVVQASTGVSSPMRFTFPNAAWMKIGETNRTGATNHAPDTVTAFHQYYQFNSGLRKKYRII